MLLQNDVYRCMMIAYTYKKRLLGEERKWGGRLYTTKFQLWLFLRLLPILQNFSLWTRAKWDNGFPRRCRVAYQFKNNLHLLRSLATENYQPKIKDKIKRSLLSVGWSWPMQSPRMGSSNVRSWYGFNLPNDTKTLAFDSLKDLFFSFNFRPKEKIILPQSFIPIWQWNTLIILSKSFIMLGDIRKGSINLQIEWGETLALNNSQ